MTWMQVQVELIHPPSTVNTNWSTALMNIAGNPTEICGCYYETQPDQSPFRLLWFLRCMLPDRECASNWKGFLLRTEREDRIGIC